MENLTRAMRRSAVLCCILGLLSACSIGPHYSRPKFEAPAAYKEQSADAAKIPGNWKTAAPKDFVSRGKWWEILQDPQLNALEEQVSVSNQNVAVAEAQYRQARALVQSARAAYFPTITGGASVTKSRQSTNLGRRSVSASPIVDDFNLPFDVTWEADVWGRVRQTVTANQASAQASAGDLQTTLLSLHAEVATDYIQLRALDTQKQLLDASVVEYAKSLNLEKNLYAAGVAAKADVVQADTQLKTTQAQAIDVGVQRAQLEHAIALLIGKPASTFSIPGARLAGVPPAIPPGLPSELLERRPDIAAAERRVAGANAQIGVAQTAFFPSLTLSGAAGFESSTVANWLTVPSRFWSLGPALAQTLFDGGLRRAQTEQARAAYDAAVATYRQSVLTGFQEVEDNLAALRILEQEAEVQDEAVKAAQESVKLTTNQYRAGTVSYLNVIQAQNAALVNQRTAVTIQSSRMSAAVLLVKALGGGWSTDELPSPQGVTTGTK